jgi:DNA replication protein DnaC
MATHPDIRSMIGLPATEAAQGALEDSPDSVHLKERLSLCLDRDAIKADRPDDCWCLGLGWPTRDEIHWAYYRDGSIAENPYCPCPEGVASRDEYLAQRNQEHAEKKQMYVEQMWYETANIPFHFCEYRLDSSPLPSSVVDPLRRPNDDDENWDQWSRSSWYFWGPHGRGKTGLATSHAYERLIADPQSILFRAVPDLLSELRSTYGREDGARENEVLGNYASVGILILDDLGAEHVSGSGWLEDRLYQIIGQRHREELPTIFTSNLNIQQIGERIGERIAWRIVEMCGDNIISVQGVNQRDRRRPHGHE